MITVDQLPVNFSSDLFARKYGLDPMTDIAVGVNGEFIVPRLPNLTLEDLLDCVAIPPASADERLEAAELMIDLLLDTQQETP